MYFRIYFNVLRSVTDQIESCYLNEKHGIILVQKERRKMQKILMKLYSQCGKQIVGYLNLTLNDLAFELIFLTYRAGIEYLGESFLIVNYK